MESIKLYFIRNERKKQPGKNASVSSVFSVFSVGPFKLKKKWESTIIYAMEKDKFHYRKDVAFINREPEIKFLQDYIDIRPEALYYPQGKGHRWGIILYFESIA